MGMSITPAGTPNILNYSLFRNQPLPMQSSPAAADASLENNMDKSIMERSSARRKQSYPTKANVQIDLSINKDKESDKAKDREEDEYIPDFTGNSPWCNLVKGKVNITFWYFITRCDFKIG